MRVFIFNRGLRMEDNTTLLKMLGKEDPLVCIFVFTPEQVRTSKYFCANAVTFMIETLNELKKGLSEKWNIPLYFFEGDLMEILENIHGKIEAITEIGYNIDYTPYARKREKRIRVWAEKAGIRVVAEEDHLLLPIATALKKDGTPYKVFTPFKNHAMQQEVRRPDLSCCPRSSSIPLGWKTAFSEIALGQPPQDLTSSSSPYRLVRGGRTEALRYLDALRTFADYEKTRDILFRRTTLLSAYLSFGVLSIREVYWKIVEHFGKSHALISELLWRDFYTAIQYYFPYVIASNFKPSFNKMVWENDPVMFKKWQTGTTGFPCVDAGMRQLLKEGFMANRCRMITSSFLVKQLLIDWRYGERHFARHLTDVYFPSNNGGWQWTFGGVDPNYFRVFNPLTQGKKYDSDCSYIKMYIPELRSVPPEHIHQWDVFFQKYPDIDYPAPCVNLKDARRRFLERVSQMKN